MKSNNLKNFKKLVSGDQSNWLKDIEWQEANESWLDLSFTIAIHILSKISENKISKEGIYSQKMLAAAMGCSEQYISKLLKGTENLTLETISKIQKVMGIRLIEVPDYESVPDIASLGFIEITAVSETMTSEFQIYNNLNLSTINGKNSAGHTFVA